ncbi:hypothetical protein FLONG3_2806 [Fusarium longipes]|uniref:Uncharacterized protein n=1 Tax=Fusarium longipes TaxID=694270 RepID=A0A395T2K1_9HYPO|nr:hypothetical protein FLONG3_2806 [Fusarium longipes]
MPSSTITSLLWSGDSSLTVKGQAYPDVNAEGEFRTSTHYLLQWCDGPSDTVCEYQTAFLELGPWASETLPEGAAETGTFDVHGLVDGTPYTSVCDMSRSVIQKCTVKKNFGYADYTSYKFSRTKGETGAEFTLSYYAVTLTSGFEDFSSASEVPSASRTTSGVEASSTNDTSSTADASIGGAGNKSDSPSETGTSAVETTATESSSSTDSTDAPSPGSHPVVRVFTALVLAGMATALVI